MLRTTIARLASIRHLEPTVPHATAVPRKRGNHARPFRTADELLSDVDLQAILTRANATAQTPLQPESRIAVLAHLSRFSNEPVASDVFPDLHSASDMAIWFSKQLRPLGARPHARKLFHSMLIDDSEDCNKIDQLDERIAIQRQSVQEQLNERLPSNLSLDDKTFRAPAPLELKRPRVFVRPNVQKQVQMIKEKQASIEQQQMQQQMQQP